MSSTEQIAKSLAACVDTDTGRVLSLALPAVDEQLLNMKEGPTANRVLHQGYLIGAAIGIIMTGLSVLAAPSIMQLLRAPGDVVAPGTAYLRVASGGFILASWMFVGNAALRGAGDTRATLAVTAAGLWLVRVPLAMLLTGPLGLLGAWIAMGIDLNLRGLGMFLRFRSGRWMKVKV